MVIGAERHAGRSVSGGCYLLTAIQSLTRVPRLRPPKEREAALFYRPRTSQSAKNFPVRQPPSKKREKFLPPTRRLPCREVRGDEGGLEGEGHPPKGGPSPSKVFPIYSLPPPRLRRVVAIPLRLGSAAEVNLNADPERHADHKEHDGCPRAAALRQIPNRE